MTDNEFMDGPDDDLGRVLVEKAEGVKCPRCWKIHPVRVNFQDLCDRCCHSVVEDYPNHWSVSGIKASYAMQREVMSWKWGTT